MKKLIWMGMAGLLTAAAASPALAWDRDDSCGRHDSWGWHDSWHRNGRRYPHTVIGFSYYSGWPYYRSGYHRPVEVVQVVPVAPAADTVVINVPNSNGSYTPVTLRRAGGLYIGPRGEQYLNLPTVEQLQGVYGLK